MEFRLMNSARIERDILPLHHNQKPAGLENYSVWRHCALAGIPWHSSVFFFFFFLIWEFQYDWMAFHSEWAAQFICYFQSSIFWHPPTCFSSRCAHTHTRNVCICISACTDTCVTHRMWEYEANDMRILNSYGDNENLIQLMGFRFSHKSIYLIDWIIIANDRLNMHFKTRFWVGRRFHFRRNSYRSIETYMFEWFNLKSTLNARECQLINAKMHERANID